MVTWPVLTLDFHDCVGHYLASVAAAVLRCMRSLDTLAVLKAVRQPCKRVAKIVAFLWHGSAFLPPLPSHKVHRYMMFPLSSLNSMSINLSDNLLKCYVFMLACPLWHNSLWFMFMFFHALSQFCIRECVQPLFCLKVFLCNSISLHFDDFMIDI